MWTLCNNSTLLLSWDALGKPRGMGQTPALNNKTGTKNNRGHLWNAYWAKYGVEFLHPVLDIVHTRGATAGNDSKAKMLVGTLKSKFLFRLSHLLASWPWMVHCKVRVLLLLNLMGLLRGFKLLNKMTQNRYLKHCPTHNVHSTNAGDYYCM